MLPAALLALTFMFGAVALTAANTIQSGGRKGVSSRTVTPTDLEPAFCYNNGVRPTAIVIVHTNQAGGNASELVIGDATGAHAALNGNGGNDCVLAGAGFVDTTNGGNGTGDVCMGTHLEDFIGTGCEYTQAWPY